MTPAASAAEGEEGRWRPIESAPRDGSVVLVWPEDGECVTAEYYRGQWIPFASADFDAFDFSGDRIVLSPTHWHPLPAPPALPHYPEPAHLTAAAAMAGRKA